MFADFALMFVNSDNNWCAFIMFVFAAPTKLDFAKTHDVSVAGNPRNTIEPSEFLEHNIASRRGSASPCTSNILWRYHVFSNILSGHIGCSPKPPEYLHMVSIHANTFICIWNAQKCNVMNWLLDFILVNGSSPSVGATFWARWSRCLLKGAFEGRSLSRLVGGLCGGRQSCL